MARVLRRVDDCRRSDDERVVGRVESDVRRRLEVDANSVSTPLDRQRLVLVGLRGTAKHHLVTDVHRLTARTVDDARRGWQNQRTPA